MITKARPSTAPVLVDDEMLDYKDSNEDNNKEDSNKKTPDIGSLKTPRPLQAISKILIS